MTVGSHGPDNIKTELFDFGTNTWETMDDYPYSSNTAFGFYEMVFIQEFSAYYVIGGFDGKQLHSTIAKFHNGVWSQAGQLNQPRHVSLRFLKPLI